MNIREVLHEAHHQKVSFQSDFGFDHRVSSVSKLQLWVISAK